MLVIFFEQVSGSHHFDYVSFFAALIFFALENALVSIARSSVQCNIIKERSELECCAKGKCMSMHANR